MKQANDYLRAKYEKEIEMYLVKECDLDRENVRWYASRVVNNKVNKYYEIIAYVTEYENEMMEELDEQEVNYRISIEVVMRDVVEPIMIKEHRDEQLTKLLGEDLKTLKKNRI